MATDARTGNWPLFAFGVLFWGTVTCLIPPFFCGGDVFIFRDAGSNLAMEHRFVTSGLLYAGDLQSRLFAHYTPIVPMSYGLFATVFGVGQRTATFFFLLTNAVIAGLAFYLLDKAGVRSRLEKAIRIAFIVLLPVLFSEPDRPESAAIVLLMLTVIASLNSGRGSWAVQGIAVAATFLAHPYAGILAALWVAAVCGLRARLGQTRWSQAVMELVRSGGLTVLVVAVLAGVFYWIDPTSLRRFLGHSFGGKSGLGILKPEEHAGLLGGIGTRYWELLRHNLTPHNPLYFSCFGLLVSLAVVGWRFGRTAGGRGPVEHWIAGTSLLALLTMPVLFPNQGQYMAVATFFVAASTLAVSAKVHSPELARRACWYLAIVLLSRAPMWFYYMLPRVQSAITFTQAAHQPDDLLARLPSRDATVAILGGDYDLFKANLPHLVGVQYFVPGEDLTQVQGIAFCPTAAADLSDGAFERWDVLDRSQFELLERAPLRSRLTLLGHSVGQSYWGWGCNLYVRRGIGGLGK
jgi:hypothetical protein